MDKAMDLLGKLAEKLNTSVELLWKVLLEQARIEAIMSLTVVGLLLTLIVFGFYARYALIRAGNKNGKLDSGFVFMSWFLLISVVIMMSCGIISETRLALTGFYNPEYWALNRVLEVLK
jgi:hypothetical protein